jgi:hypothetical protein
VINAGEPVMLIVPEDEYLMRPVKDQLRRAFREK